MRMLFLDDRDLMEETVRTLRFAAVARIDPVDCDRSIEDKFVGRVDLSERVVHVRELVGGDLAERIPFRRPVGVVADDFEWRGRWGGGLRICAQEQCSETRENDGDDAHENLS